MLGAVVERLLKALREGRPGTVRQFFALASQHMRWELNEMARRLDEQPTAAELREGLVPAPAGSDSQLTADVRRMLEAIERLRRASARRSSWCASRGCRRLRPPACLRFRWRRSTGV